VSNELKVTDGNIMKKYEPPEVDDRHIWDLFLSHTHQTALVVADEMGLIAALESRPSSISELAQHLNYDERATGILLRLLAALGLLELHQGRFQPGTQALTYLLKSSPYYWGSMMRAGANDVHVKTLTAALQKENSAISSGPEGTPVPVGSGRSADSWATGNVSSEQAVRIAAMMHGHSLLAAMGVARNYDFSAIRRLLDVGGGSGCFTIAISQKYPHMRNAILELPTMCDVARTYIQNGNVSDSVETISCDMFRQPWPRGYDAVLFSNIWHDWNFRTCTWLAARAFETLPGGGRILLHEMLLNDDGAGPLVAASFSMLMLLGTQGQQFTLGELRGILEQAGFVRVESRSTSVYYSVVTGYKN
jgi:acetylserotonin N-methyltransferase